MAITVKTIAAGPHSSSVFPPKAGNPLSQVAKQTYKTSHWYQAYCAAMLQLDAQKFLHEAETARKAIQGRVAELVWEKSGSDGEPVKLREALDYLSLLLECFRQEEGRLLWR